MKKLVFLLALSCTLVGCRDNFRYPCQDPDNFGKEIMNQRSRMGIKNGIILMERFSKFNYMVTLGTGFSNFDSFDFIKRYHDRINLIKNDFINLIKKDAYTFLPKPIYDN